MDLSQGLFRSSSKKDHKIEIVNRKAACTHGFEGGHICHTVVWRDVVNSNPSILFQSTIRKLCNTLISSVTGSIIHNSGPIITEILTESTARAIRSRWQIVFHRLHGCVEGVPSNDLVRVWRADDSQTDERIEALYYQLGACEAKHSCRCLGVDYFRAAQERESEYGPMHRDCIVLNLYVLKQRNTGGNISAGLFWCSTYHIYTDEILVLGKSNCRRAISR